MSLYQKYRPTDFSEIKGNNEIKETLSVMLSDRKKCPHSFLLTGPTGCGKTTIARIIAKKLNCNKNDFKEIDSADFRGIDSIRTIRKKSQYKPLEGDVIVWLLDECHKLSNDAQNALLKILEDTPKHVYFILATTDPQKLISTIKGRCSCFQVQPLSERNMYKLLREVVKKENEILEKEIYEQIIDDAQGHPRNALTVLEQVLSVEPEKRLIVAKRTAEEKSEAIELCRALFEKSSWKKVRTILMKLKGQDAESIRRVILGYAQTILLRQENDLAARIIEEFMEPLYNVGFSGLVYNCYVITKNI